MDSVSLDNRKIQLTQKVEQFGAAEPSKPISSPYDTQADQGTETNEPEVIQSDIPAEDVTENVSLPETNETPKTPSPQVGNMAAPGMANPYAGAVYADYTKGKKRRPGSVFRPSCISTYYVLVHFLWCGNRNLRR